MRDFAPSPEFRTAIVTGSTSGIGFAVARALAEAGHAVMLNGLGDPAAIEIARAEMERDTGAPIGFHGADMSDPDQIADLVAATEARFGQIDIVVNNAGIQTVAPIEAFPVDRYELIMAVNMSAAWHLCRATFAGMKERGRGRVINVASAHQIPETAQARGITEEEVVRDVLLAAQPTKAFVQPGQVGALAAFLCSAAAGQITGAALPIDGGWTAH